MSSDWVTAIATSATAVVIAASAIAALIQIRHMRKGNEIEIIDKWTETIESEKFQQSRTFALRELPRLLQDPEKVRSIEWEIIPPEIAPIRIVCNHFEAVGSFIKLGSVDAKVACELWALVVLQCWNAIAPATALIRKRHGTDTIWENFEYLAVLSEDYMANRKQSSYPRGVRRMPVDSSLLATLDEDG